MKKFLSFFIALALVFSLAAITTVAATEEAVYASVPVPAVWDGTVATSFAGGNGTESNPYIIANGAQFAYLAANTQGVNPAKSFTNGKYFSLSNSIDFNNIELVAPDGFYGTFLGNGYEISNTNFTKGSMFRINHGTVSNLKFKVTSSTDVSKGIITDTNQTDGIIEFCSVSGDFFSNTYYCYGICGTNSGIIRYCQVKDATFGGGYAVAGAIAGYFNDGEIYDCYLENVTMTRTDNATSFNPIIGSAVASMNGTYASMNNVHARNITLDLDECEVHSYVGGLIGALYDGTVTNSSVEAEISILSNGNKALEAGGFTGYLRGDVLNCYSKSNITINENGSSQKHAYGGFTGTQQTGSIVMKSFASGSVYLYAPATESSEIYVGGFIGETYTGLVRKNCIADCNVVSYSSEGYAGQFVGDYESASSGDSSECYYNNTKRFYSENAYTQYATGVADTLDWDFLKNSVGLKEYISESTLENNPNAVWCYFALSDYPTLYSENTGIYTFSANGGNVAPDGMTVAFENNGLMPENIGTMAGYRFCGWNTKADGTGTMYQPGATCSLTGINTFYAIWKKAQAEGIDIQDSNFAMTIGGRADLTYKTLPTDLLDRNIVWTSSDETVATVNEKGQVFGIGTGITTITAELAGFTDWVSVRVVERSETSGTCGYDAVWKIDGNKLIIEGEGYLYEDYGWYGWDDFADSIVCIEFAEGIESVPTYAFKNFTKLTSVIFPSTMRVVFKGAFAGCTSLKNVYYYGTQEQYNLVGVDVENTCLTDAALNLLASGMAPVTQVVGLRTQSAVLNAETNEINITAFDTEKTAGVAIVTEGVTDLKGYTTDSGNGISVSSTGEYKYFVARLSYGTQQSFNIYASVNGINHLFKVNIVFVENNIAVESVSLDKNILELSVDDTATLLATVLPENAKDRSVTWKSSNTAVATVDNGVVTAVGEGTATITVTTDDGEFSDTCLVTVSKSVEVGPGDDQGSTGGGVTEIASGSCGENANWTLSSDGVLVVSGSGVMSGYTAKTTPWYEYRNDITKIVVTGVATIGEYAFNYCTNATEVIIEEGVKVIYRNAFAYCSSITTFYLPSTLTTINKAVFYNCSALTDVHYNGTLGGYSKITVEGSNAPLNSATIHFASSGVSPVPTEVKGLRTESVSYNAETNTITAVALNTNASAGVAIVVDGVNALSDYSTVSGNGITVSNKDGYRYFVAKLANGAEQSTEIYATVNGTTYTYIFNITFVDEVISDSPIADIATLRCYEASFSDSKKTITVNVDRFPVIAKSGSFGIAIIPAEGYAVSYNFTGNNSSTDSESRFSSSNTSKYTLLSTGVNTESSGGGALGNLPLKIITKVDATRFYVDVTLTKGEESVTYKMTVALRDRAVEGDVDISEILPLRADPDSFILDNENKTIYYETAGGARSAGFAVKVDNGLTAASRNRRLLTAASGYQLAHGEITGSLKDDYDRYVVARKSAGNTQVYKIKVHGGEDGLTYTWYTVTVVFK